MFFTSPPSSKPRQHHKIKIKTKEQKNNKRKKNKAQNLQNKQKHIKSVLCCQLFLEMGFSLLCD